MIHNKQSPNDLSGFYVIYKGSCHLEEDGEKGLSHLMEHLVCKSFSHLTPEFDAYAMEWNAWTSQNEVAFYITGLDEHVNRYKYQLLESLSKFEITQEELDNEKEIVKQEYLMSFNDAFQGHYLNVWRKFYGFYNPIGALGDIEGVTLDKCNEYYQKQFARVSDIINISKDSPFNGEINEFFEPDTDGRIYEFKQHEDFVLEQFPIGEAQDSLFMISDPVPEDQQHLAHFVCSLLSNGLLSPLYREIREKHGLLYNLALFLNPLNKARIPMFYTTAQKENIPKIVDLTGKVLSNPEEYVTFDDFLKMKSLFKNQFKIAEINNHNNIDEFITPELKKLKDDLQSIKHDDCLELIKNNFNMENWKISIGEKMLQEG